MTEETEEISDTEEVATEVESVESTDEQAGAAGVSRRGTLGALAGLGALGLGATGTAAADTTDFSTYMGQDHSAGSNSFGLGLQGGGSTSPILKVESYTDGGLSIIGWAKGSGNVTGFEGRSTSADGYGVVGRNTQDGVGLFAESRGGGYGIQTPDDADVGGTLEVGGDLQVSGTKNFVHSVDTTGGPKNVFYTAIEAGEARTEHSDVAETSDGRAEIELPEHFRMVTSEEEPLVVQVTPYAQETVNPQVVEQSPDRVVVEDRSDCDTEYTFAYTVKGVREGFEDQEIVEEPRNGR